jgi:hypothetical protein
MIDAAKIDTIKADVDLIAVAESYAKLRKKTRTERCGPCPHCGGRDRFFVNADYWACRGCHEKPGDAVDLVRWMDGCDFITALEKLSGENLRDSDGDENDTNGERRRIVRDDRVEVWKTAKWQTRAMSTIEEMAAALETDAGAPGRAYLEQRGITQHTWRCWLLGYALVSPPWDPELRQRTGGAAITIPYMHSRNDTCFAVRYRRIVARTGEDRYVNEGGSFCLLHGLHMIDLNAHTLVIVEGELNAISIWQAARDLGVAVVSIGSQYLKKETLEATAKFSTFFPRSLVWCDDPDRALRVRRAVQSRAVLPLKSPELDGVKIDANDMLQRGLLGAFIDRKLSHADARQYMREAA